jgi:hypothetical protein
MDDQKKKDQNVKFKKSAIDFKAIKSTNNPSLTSEDETIRSAAVNTKNRYVDEKGNVYRHCDIVADWC